METSLLRYRKETHIDSNAASESSKSSKSESESQSKQLDDKKRGDDDSWIANLISCLRIVACFVMMMFMTSLWCLILFCLLPWPKERIKQGNVYGHLTGWLMIWILGNPIKIEGAEFSKGRAIYICNHASPLDVFLMMWLIPTGTVAIAKKEIVWYPLLGQLYFMANHLRIDRSNPISAIESLKKAAETTVNNNLSLMIFPEGTRSMTGRLLRFRKGFVHMALQTRLPIVPIVLTGTHLAWRKNSLRVRPVPLTVKFFPPISTNDWREEKMDEYIEMIHDIYVKNLPESQRPLIMEQLDSTSIR